MKTFLFIILATCGLSAGLHAQTGHTNANDRQPPASYENIHVEKLDDDALATTFLIWVKQAVKEHFHAEHTEVVMVLEGEGEMTLGESTFNIGPGSYVFIPKGTHHSVVVKGDTPLKALSVQTPHFDGSDRHFTTQ